MLIKIGARTKFLNRPILLKLMCLAFACVLLLSFSSCRNEGSAIEKTANVPAVEIYNEAIAISNIPGSGSAYPVDINAYLLNQAEEMNLEAKIDEYGNVIIEKPASEGMKDLPVTVLFCSTHSTVAAESMILDIESNIIGSQNRTITATRNLGISTILSILKYSDKTGPIKAIFTCDTDPVYSASAYLDKFIEDASYLIGFSGVEGISVYNESPSTRLLTSKMDIQRVAPNTKYAYVIAATGYPFNSNSRITPLKAISDILTTAKTGGLYFELASIEANSEPLLSPSEATAIVLLDDYEKKRFSSMFSGFAKEYTSSLPKGYENVNLQLIDTKLPQAVLSDGDTDKIVAYLYGLFNNGNIPEASDILPMCINKISLNDNAFSCTISVLGNDETLAQIISDQSSISEFTGITLIESGSIAGYKTVKDGLLSTRLQDSMSKYINEKVAFNSLLWTTELGTIAKNNPDISTISLGWDINSDAIYSERVSLNDIAAPANTVIDFLSHLDEIKEDNSH